MARIFPRDERFAAYRDAAWDAYLMFCNAYDDLLPLLETEYVAATQRFVADGKKKHGFSPQERLAEHLMAYYWRDKLTLDSALLQEFCLIRSLSRAPRVD